ncbi:hypothetical protein F5Y16DRAFT_394568 [Xylariaceae sp. FL0255]|nr:hypothetical protein F5Y16DRAFT_394568 [Xylariaceae sp. FL0255]
MASIRSLDDEAFKTVYAVEQVKSEEQLFRDDQLPKQPCTVVCLPPKGNGNSNLCQSSSKLNRAEPHQDIMSRPFKILEDPRWAQQPSNATASTLIAHEATDDTDASHASTAYTGTMYALYPVTGNCYTSAAYIAYPTTGTARTGTVHAEHPTTGFQHITKSEPVGHEHHIDQVVHKPNPKGLKNSRWADKPDEAMTTSAIVAPALSTPDKPTRPRLTSHHTLSAIQATLAGASTGYGQRAQKGHRSGRGQTTQAQNKQGTHGRPQQSQESATQAITTDQEHTPAETEENPFKGAVIFDWEEFNREVKAKNLKTLKNSRWA